jgi:hypothetical protein
VLCCAAGLAGAPGAAAAPARPVMTARAVTWLGPAGAAATLPDPTVTAYWGATRDGRSQLEVNGRNLPATTTVVTADWFAPGRTVPRDGTVLVFDHAYDYGGVPGQAAATYRIVVSYRLAGGTAWHDLYSGGTDYRGEFGLVDSQVREHVRIWWTALARKQLTLRWHATLTLPSGAPRYSDRFTIG